MCPTEQLREPHVEGSEDGTLLSWMGSQPSPLLHGPWDLCPSFSLKAYVWDRRWHWATSCPARAKLLGQDTRHFLAWLRVWGLRGGGGDIPAPPRQFVHFLPWLQIPTISFSAASGLCPLPGPALTPRDRGPSCPASSDFGSSAALNPASAKKP